MVLQIIEDLAGEIPAYAGITRKEMTKVKLSNVKLRVISGKWRGRKFQFPAISDLRPTTDRIRETLFNWLTSYISGAKCLDLFAGSGILGLEALSRGAAQVDFYDASIDVVNHLKNLLHILEEPAGRAHHAVIPDQLPAQPEQPYDIVFLDPPFHKNLIESTCAWLEQQDWIAPQGLIYLEHEISLNNLALPPHWKIIKSSQTGQVSYHLAQR